MLRATPNVRAIAAGGCPAATMSNTRASAGVRPKSAAATSPASPCCARDATKTAAAGVSHELRTPLNAIGGCAELIELGIWGPVTAEQRADLEKIQRAQRHLLGLINGVLNYARVEAGAVHYQFEDVVLDEVLAACEALVAPQARAKQLTLTRDAPLDDAHSGAAWPEDALPEDARPEDALRVRADREKLQQVVLNLLSNAVKFTEPGGRIALWRQRGARPVDVDGPTVCVVVRDTGVGIPADQLARAFEPFVQVDQRLTRT